MKRKEKKDFLFVSKNVQLIRDSFIFNKKYYKKKDDSADNKDGSTKQNERF